MLCCVLLCVVERISRRAAGRSLSHLAQINQTRIQRRSSPPEGGAAEEDGAATHGLSAGLFGF